MAYAGKNTSRTSDSALSTLPLLLYLAVAIGLMLADHRQGYGRIARQHLSVITQPFWWLASSPLRAYRAASENLAFRSSLQEDNSHKRRDLAIAIARIHDLNAVEAENLRLRRLLGGTRGYTLNVSLVGIVDIDLDPYRQRLVLDAGSVDGVRIGQALIDSGGVMGQIMEVGKHQSTALLVTDADHAVPVQVARSGLRTIAYGTGHSDRLVLPNVPQSADIRKGDLLITSGIGGRFPAGFPVGTITAVRADQLRLFVIADARPAAHLERGNEVLLIHNRAPGADVGPPVPPGLRAAAAKSAAEKMAAANLAAEKDAAAAIAAKRKASASQGSPP